MKFFNVPFEASSTSLVKEVTNKGKKNDVWPQTVKLLDDFFQPYNERLASLLGDKKWLFERDNPLEDGSES